MLPLLVPIISMLASNGLNLLANAVTAKGKEFVEDKLGVKLDEPKTQEELLKLKQLEIDHEEFLIEAGIRKAEQELESEKVAQGNVTERWKADMLSDSWLSKNIRPIVLIFLLTVYTIFSIASGFDFDVTKSYVELLAQMLMLVMGAYFAGRTVEKIVDMKERGK